NLTGSALGVTLRCVESLPCTSQLYDLKTLGPGRWGGSVLESSMNDFSRTNFGPAATSGIKLPRTQHEYPLAPMASAPVQLIFWGQWAVATAIQVALLVALTLDKSGDVPSAYRILAVIAALLAIPLCALFRTYSTRNGYLVGLARLAVAWATLTSVLIFIGFVTKTTETYSREVALQWILGGYTLQALAFLPLHKLARKVEGRVNVGTASIVIGSGQLAYNLATKLRYERNEQMLGLVAIDEDDDAAPDNTTYFPTLGVVSQLRSVLSENRVQRVYIALPARETDQIEGLYVDLLDASVDVVWVPDFANLKLLNHSVHNLGG